MPPQALPHHVTMQELFANEPDEIACSIASKMTLFMLMSYRYVRIEDVTGINVYPATFYYIVASAFNHYDDHASRIIRNFRFPERGIFRIIYRHVIHRMYRQYSVEDPLDVAILSTCVFAMNICRYLQERRISRWYTMSTVILLAHFIGGERFRRDANFDGFEEVFSIDVSLPLWLASVAGFQSREPHETYSNMYSFEFMLYMSTPLSTPLYFSP